MQIICLGHHVTLSSKKKKLLYPLVNRSTCVTVADDVLSLAGHCDDYTKDVSKATVTFALQPRSHYFFSWPLLMLQREMTPDGSFPSTAGGVGADSSLLDEFSELSITNGDDEVRRGEKMGRFNHGDSAVYFCFCSEYGGIAREVLEDQVLTLSPTPPLEQFSFIDDEI